MRFEKWEEEVFNYLTKLYDNFFEELYDKINLIKIINYNLF